MSIKTGCVCVLCIFLRREARGPPSSLVQCVVAETEEGGWSDSQSDNTSRPCNLCWGDEFTC